MFPPNDSLEMHPLITRERVVGNGYRVSCRHYSAADEVELLAIRLNYDETLKKGGGARRKNKDKSQMDDVTLHKSIARARTTLRRKVLAMGADRILTLTFRENLTDLEEAWRVFKTFVRLMRFRYRERFVYAAVPEFQKRGAVHFHLALAGYYHIKTIRRFWLKACGELGGNVDITNPQKYGKNSWNPKRIARYIAKYLSKSDSVAFNKRRYSSGGDIPIPDPEIGWLALGVPVVQVLRQIVERLTRKPLACVLEIDSYYNIIYCST